jgi:hypothetical protein
MSFPMGVSAVGIPVNLPGYCLNPVGTGHTTPWLQLTTADMQGIWGGSTANWTQLADSTNANLANCDATSSGVGPPIAITRVVRQDDSGTTQNFDNYMANAFGAGTSTCVGGSGTTGTFGNMQLNEQLHGTNVNWPQGGTCNAITNSASGGTQNLLNVLETTTGGIGYGDYSDIYHDNNTPAVITTVSVEASDNLTFNLPNSGGFPNSTLGAIGASNCVNTGLAIAAGGINGAVGEGGQWALDFGGSNVVNDSDNASWTKQGNKYPICSLTWDMTYSGENGNTDPTNTAGATAQSLPASTLTVATDTQLPNSGTITFTDTQSVFEVASYTGISGSNWLNQDTTGAKQCVAGGCTLTGVSFKTTPGAGATIAAGATFTLQPADTANGDQTLPLTGNNLVLNSTTGFPGTGTVTTTNPGALTMTYSGITGNTLNNVTVTSGTNTGTISSGTGVAVSSAAGVGGAEPNLNADERKMLYGFFTYVLSPAGQAATTGAGYAGLPATVGYLDQVRQGFQRNF